MRDVHTLVIGGGQAGLAMSYCLGRRGIEHVVLERGRIAETWRSQRWDSFTVVGPNWSVSLPGAPFAGRDPDGFMPRDELVQFLESYARLISAPVETGVDVQHLEPAGDGWRAVTSSGEIHAQHVVLATGTYQQPIVPKHSFDPSIVTLHSADYKRPALLPDGAVLVVGSGQSGAQIAEELALAGRGVWIASSRCGWRPRRYRGRDNTSWRQDMGWFDVTIETFGPEARFAATPMQTGRDGGRDISLRTLANVGVKVLGRFIDANGTTASLAADVEMNVRASDESALALCRQIDDFIREHGIVAPEQPPLDVSLPPLDTRTSLDLIAEGITSVIWATGFGLDFSWVTPAIGGERGYPVQRRGVTEPRGLYVLGLHAMWKRNSGLIYGVGDDAAYLADYIAANVSLASPLP